MMNPNVLAPGLSILILSWVSLRSAGEFAKSCGRMQSYLALAGQLLLETQPFPTVDDQGQ
jgi:hypothetical protein